MTRRQGIVLLAVVLLCGSGLVAACDGAGPEPKKGSECETSDPARTEDGEFFYYSDERKIPLELAEWWNVVQIPDRTAATVDSVVNDLGGIHLRRVLDSERGLYWLEGRNRDDIKPRMLDQLDEHVPVRRRMPSFYLPESDTSYYLITDEFNVKFDSTVTRAEIEDVNATYGVELAFESGIDSMQARDYNTYLLRVKPESACNALEAANLYYEDSRTEWSVPNAYVEIIFP